MPVMLRSASTRGVSSTLADSFWSVSRGASSKGMGVSRRFLLSSGFAAGFTSGFTAGFTSGFASGFASGFTAGFTSGFTADFTSGFAASFTSGFTSGFATSFTSGFAAGFTSGFFSTWTGFTGTCCTEACKSFHSFGDIGFFRAALRKGSDWIILSRPKRNHRLGLSSAPSCRNACMY